jgi:hypothetical protein
MPPPIIYQNYSHIKSTNTPTIHVQYKECHKIKILQKSTNLYLQFSFARYFQYVLKYSHHRNLERIQSAILSHTTITIILVPHDHKTELIYQRTLYNYLKQGLTIGARSSGVLSKIFLQNKEASHIANLAKMLMIINLCRYVEKFLLIFDSTKTNIKSTLADSNSIHTTLHFTAET